MVRQTHTHTHTNTHTHTHTHYTLLFFASLTLNINMVILASRSFLICLFSPAYPEWQLYSGTGSYYKDKRLRYLSLLVPFFCFCNLKYSVSSVKYSTSCSDRPLLSFCAVDTDHHRLDESLFTASIGHYNWKVHLNVCQWNTGDLDPPPPPSSNSLCFSPSFVCGSGQPRGGCAPFIPK